MFVHREAVRFRDLDPMGHVNNAVFLTYIESARAAFLQHLGAVQTLEDLAIIVARIEIDFRAPVRFGDEVDVTVRVSRFGEKSFDLEHELRVGVQFVEEFGDAAGGLLAYPRIDLRRRGVGGEVDRASPGAVLRRDCPRVHCDTE